MKYYLNVIQEELDKRGKNHIDSHAVLGFMRLKYGTLDHLSRAQFNSEVRAAIQYHSHFGEEEFKDFANHA